MCSWREERCRRRCLSRFVQAKGLQKAFNRSPLGLNLYPWLNYRIFPAWRPGIRQSISPSVVTSKPANGDGPGRCCSTSLGLDSASPF